MRPLVSVVIPAYRAERFIEETLASVRDQDYRPLEVVVVEDCSPDRTAELVQLFADQDLSSDLQVRLLRQPKNMGGGAALRRGFAAATGEFICWLSADDAFVDPLKTSLQVERLTGAECGVSYGRAFLLGESVEQASAVQPHWSKRFPPLDRLYEKLSAWRLMGLLFAVPINGSSAMISRRCLDSAGGFDPVLGNIDQDGDLWMRYSALGVPFVPIDSHAVFYRKHSGQVSSLTADVERGCSATRIRLIMALEETGQLRRVAARAWPALVIATLDRSILMRPAVGRYLLAAMERSAGVLTRNVARVISWRLERADRRGLEVYDDVVESARHLRMSDEFAQFVRLLES